MVSQLKQTLTQFKLLAGIMQGIKNNDTLNK